MSAAGPLLADAPTLDDIRGAAARIAPWTHRTPVLTCRAIDDRSGASVFLKCENFQRVGAFKFRGAMNAILQLDDESRRRGVVTHSSGNHAQALACAGSIVGVPVTVVMPRTAPAVKKRATEGYGAEVVPCEPTLAAREAAVASLIDTRGLTLIHPFDNWHVIAGQGTCALELMEQCEGLDVIVAPVGGGGLIAGTAIAARGITPNIRIIGAEPLAADDARRSLVSGVIEPSGDPKTVADGLRTSLGTRPFAVIRRLVDEVATATEPEILDALRFVWERVKVLIEPSCAVPVAPVLNRQIDGLRGLRVGIIISGGNVDLSPVIEALAAK
jgi:threonine dehydratase